MEQIETEKYYVTLIKEKLDGMTLDGDCYLAVFFLNVDGIPPERVQDLFNNVANSMQEALSKLAKFETIILPVREQDTEFKLYSLKEKNNEL